MTAKTPEESPRRREMASAGLGWTSYTRESVGDGRELAEGCWHRGFASGLWRHTGRRGTPLADRAAPVPPGGPPPPRELIERCEIHYPSPKDIDRFLEGEARRNEPIRVVHVYYGERDTVLRLENYVVLAAHLKKPPPHPERVRDGEEIDFHAPTRGDEQGPVAAIRWWKMGKRHGRWATWNPLGDPGRASMFYLDEPLTPAETKRVRAYSIHGADGWAVTTYSTPSGLEVSRFDLGFEFRCCPAKRWANCIRNIARFAPDTDMEK